MTTTESQIEQNLIAKLDELKYKHREDIRDREGLEKNFREKFEALNRVHLTDSEFARLRDEIVTSDVFTAANTLRERNTFIREDGTPLQYTLVNIKDWCKNDFEVVNQLRINTGNSHHRYDVILLINGVPVVQIELKTLQVSPRRAMEQIVEYKNDPGNGYAHTLLCFMQLFIVSNESNTYYFANNHNQHFSFNADERFLPIYQLADEGNHKIAHLHDFADNFLAKCTQKTGKQKMTRRQLIDLISANANLMDERDDIIAYINSLQVGEALTEKAIRDGYQAFKAAKSAQDLADIAEKHGLQAFVDTIMSRMIFDGEQLSDLLAPLDLGWKARTKKELALMEDLVPMLNKLAQGREISGLAAYE
jgi:type I site-specific restriction-modification system R (restriction) subunit